MCVERIWTTTVLVAACVASPACSSEGSSATAATEASSTDTSDGTDTSTSMSTTGPLVCDRCVATPPEGWTGPVALARTPPGNEPTCEGAYAQDAQTFGETFRVGSVSCECLCSEATGIECVGSASVCYGEGADSCSLDCDPPDLVVDPGVCTASPATGSQHGRTRMPDPIDPGACEPSEAHVIQEPSFGTAVRTCARVDATEVGCMESEVCAPEPGDAFDRVCIFQLGQHDCPEPFRSRTLVWSGFEDDRSCAACSCGPATSACTGSLQNSGSAACDNITSTIPANSCAMTFGEGFTRWDLAPSGTCAPSPTQLSGEANPVGQTTVCCLT
jgi:hypothetical protein